jgi:F0F1-type ATP synthase membrane subunit c/vacuolar-type H+-ATPase subunit K
MSKPLTIHRRQFLLLALGVAGSVAAGSKLSGAAEGWLRQASLRAKLTGLFIHQESAQAIGRAYLQSYPREADALRLEDQIVQGIAGGRALLAATGKPEVSKLLTARIRQDFASDQVVKVQGWILSVTEARLCALTALA